MAGRIRTLKPEWLDDELLAAEQDHVRLLSIALILMADDHGRGRAAVPLIAKHAWTYDQTTQGLAKAREGLARLSAVRFVTLYEVDGQSYFEIRNWSKHQRVDKPSKPRIPPPPPEESGTCGDSRNTREGGARIPEALAKAPEDLAPDLRSPISDLRSPTAEQYPSGGPGDGGGDRASTIPGFAPADPLLTPSAVLAELRRHPQLAHVVEGARHAPQTLVTLASANGVTLAQVVECIGYVASVAPDGEAVASTLGRLRGAVTKVHKRAADQRRRERAEADEDAPATGGEGDLDPRYERDPETGIWTWDCAKHGGQPEDFGVRPRAGTRRINVPAPKRTFDPSVPIDPFFARPKAAS